MYNEYKKLEGGSFIKQYIDYPSLMKRHIKKHASYMQPIFEAISNSLEATKGVGDSITIRLFLQKALMSDKYSFLSIEIEDTGIGFNEENFSRLVRLYDESKKCNNFGTGRIQYLHFFDKTDIHSVFEENGKKYVRRIVLSSVFYKTHQSVIWSSDVKEVDRDTSIRTSISFFYPLDESDKEKFSELTADSIFDKIFIRYLSRFCMNKENLQEFRIEPYVNGVLDKSKVRTITSADIPSTDFAQDFVLSYKVYDKSLRKFVTTTSNETFRVQAYLLSHKVQKKNEIKLTSKNETIDATNFDFSFLDKSSVMEEDKSMLCLVSSDFFTRNDSDERGKLHLKSEAEFLKQNDMFELQQPQIFIDEIQDEVIQTIGSHYPQIKKVKDEYENEIEHLIELFGLDRDIVNRIGYKYGETTVSFLKRYKEYDAEVAAAKDASISSAIDSLTKLNPSDSKFKEKFNRKVRDITKMIPQKNKTDVTNYLVARKAAMSILEFILKKQLEVQVTHGIKKQKNREKVIHDLLFKQHTTNTLESNLWILNEDFIHYNGISECALRDIRVNGELFLREDLSVQDIEKLKAYHRDQLGKRTDVLLFPEEHKCIIVELKSATADVTKFLNQVVDYAGLIRQYSKEKYEINQFYAYLIGESFDFDAVVNGNPNFIQSPYLDYVYIPDQKVNGGMYRPKGTMYVEVLKYSSLLERAKIRNSIFLDKLFDK